MTGLLMLPCHRSELGGCIFTGDENLRVVGVLYDTRAGGMRAQVVCKCSEKERTERGAL